MHFNVNDAFYVKLHTLNFVTFVNKGDICPMMCVCAWLNGTILSCDVTLLETLNIYKNSTSYVYAIVYGSFQTDVSVGYSRF
jgi:hypothetical protein